VGKTRKDVMHIAESVARKKYVLKRNEFVMVVGTISCEICPLDVVIVWPMSIWMLSMWKLWVNTQGGLG